MQQVFVYDIHRAAADALASAMNSRQLAVKAVDSLVAATRESQIIVTCTTSRQGFLGAAEVSPGTFIAAVGADSADKQELRPELLVKSAVIVDILEQCAAIGELHHALEAGLMRRQDVRAELADVVTGAKLGRQTAEEIVVFDSTGTAIQDLAAAAAIYEKAVALRLGHEIVLH